MQSISRMSFSALLQPGECWSEERILAGDTRMQGGVRQGRKGLPCAHGRRTPAGFAPHSSAFHVQRQIAKPMPLAVLRNIVATACTGATIQKDITPFLKSDAWRQDLHRHAWHAGK